MKKVALSGTGNHCDEGRTWPQSNTIFSVILQLVCFDKRKGIERDETSKSCRATRLNANLSVELHLGREARSRSNGASN
jgi:hypothetical protein